MTPAVIYYEIINGEFYASFEDGLFEYLSYEEMVFDFDSDVQFVEVTPDTWQQLFDQGAFN